MTARGAGSPAGDSPPPELVARFKAALDRLWPEGGKLGLAVSGGPDSLAMLLLAEAAIPGQFEVATVDHGLRPESAAECEMVARVCTERGILWEIVRLEGLGDGNLQAEARAARYSFLGLWVERRGLSALATAHHADDQAETLIMRLNRGSGLSGLAGVRERVELEGWEPDTQVIVIRPLLEFRRSELAGIVVAAGIASCTDPSNLDERFDRVRVRNALANADWLDPRAIAASARHLAEADDALGEQLAWLWAHRVSYEEDGAIVIRPDAPRITLLSAVDRAIRELGGVARGGDVARLVDRLTVGKRGNLAGVLVTVEGDEWVFRREPPRRTG